MKDWKWKNPYIELVNTKPDYLGNLENDEIPSGVANLFSSKLNAYESVYCEIGSGSGEHLIKQALKKPTSLYVGFELRYKRSYRTIEKAQQDNIQNIYVFRGNATLLSSFFSNQSLDGIYINFPDPWAKKRWKKHRILNEDFLKTAHRLLKDNGFISYKTDHKDYFNETSALFKHIGLYSISKSSYDLHSSPFSEQNILSEFEKLFISKGLAIMYLEAKKLTNISNYAV